MLQVNRNFGDKNIQSLQGQVRYMVAFQRGVVTFQKFKQGIVAFQQFMLGVVIF